MNATVLAYNFEGAELKKLKKLCSGRGVRLRAVAPGDFSQPVGALCGLCAELRRERAAMG